MSDVIPGRSMSGWMWMCAHAHTNAFCLPGLVTSVYASVQRRLYFMSKRNYTDLINLWTGSGETEQDPMAFCSSYNHNYSLDLYSGFKNTEATLHLRAQQHTWLGQDLNRKPFGYWKTHSAS